MQTERTIPSPSIALGQTNWDQPVNILRSSAPAIGLLIVASYLWLFSLFILGVRTL